MHGSLDPPPGLAAVVPAIVDRRDLETAAVVLLQNADHEQGCGLLAEFAGEITDSDLAVGGG